MQKQLKSQNKKAAAKKAPVKAVQKRKVTTVAKKQQKAKKSVASVPAPAPVFQQQRKIFGMGGASPAVKENKEKGAQFLAEKLATGDYHQHPEGFLYRFITEGQTGKGQSNNSSPKPLVTDTVLAHYEGSLIDGTVFDSSFQRGEPISAPLNRLVKGWQLVIPQMSYGDKVQCILPSDLAYQDRGAGAAIPGGATLLFNIQLLEPQLSEVEQAGIQFYQKAKESGQYQEHPAGFLYKYTGEGPAADAVKPSMSDEVTVHYQGRNVEGKVFDSSIQRGQPTKFPLTGVVPGFSIPISQLMTKDTDIQVIIPPSLAYGEASPHPLIPPHSTLIFDIQLLSWGVGHRF